MALLHCSCLHACLAAFWEEIWILCESLLTAACDVTAVEPIRRGLMNMEAFWSKPSVKVEIKNHERWLVLVKYCDLLDWIRAKWLRINAKIIPVSEKLWRSPWGFVSMGGLRPQRSISMTVNGDCSTSHLRNVRRRGLDGRYHNGDRHRDTSLTAEVVWRQKSTSCEHGQLLAFTCLQSLVLWHFQ